MPKPPETKQLSSEKSSLCQLVMRPTILSQTHSDQSHNTAFKTPIRVNYIMSQCKETYLRSPKKETKSQCRFEHHLSQIRDCELAELKAEADLNQV